MIRIKGVTPDLALAARSIFLHDGIETFPYSSLFRISLDKTWSAW